MKRLNFTVVQNEDISFGKDSGKTKSIFNKGFGTRFPRVFPQTLVGETKSNILWQIWGEGEVYYFPLKKIYKLQPDRNFVIFLTILWPVPYTQGGT